MKKIKYWPMGYSKSNLKFGHEIIKPIASMSWSRMWSDISCVSSRHQYNEEEESEEYQGWPRCKKWSKYWWSRNWSYSKYVLKTKMESALMCIFKTSTWWRMKWNINGFRTWLIIVETSYNSGNVLSNEEMMCKFKISHLEEIIWLKLAILMVIMEMWRYS